MHHSERMLQRSVLFMTVLILAPVCGQSTGSEPKEMSSPSLTRGADVSAVGPSVATPGVVPEERRQERINMVERIKMYGLTDARILKVMLEVPRHEFVPSKLSSSAYRDTPLPIGYGQTISQPFIVAEMTRLLNLRKHSKVLEIGTGSGYQAAVLAELTPHVFTVEIIKSLAGTASERLKRLAPSVEVRHGDGYNGWQQQAPFDAIIVTAAAGEIPPPLVRQLKSPGIMVIPVGPVLGTQSLMMVQKDAQGNVTTKSLMAVRFVPLVRKDNTN